MRVGSGFFLLLSLTVYFSNSAGDHVVGVLVFSASLAAILRSLVAPSIDLTESGFVFRSIYRTRRIPRSSVDGAFLTSGRPMFVVALQSLLNLRTLGGTETRLRGMEAPQRRGQPNSAVAAVADAINEWAAAPHS